ncbi:D-alanyl-D-alanine carboxypeptidase family protein [Natranaerofaba carboxydovora]|uniref:D-alanyl-D-alanine carboxypeptidase family protein n=1 Tax=Natranaerofaba carboxydovora TaxID=2742683 RepID=UPI001F131E9D|nr:D-alanyl-D-alanine carboxypeptidase family protein [Natranaerofaba carboxydovora]UMZ73922.1 D-alanyl-D-alanine carboxypeptidase DacF [Natranaerofaba carboxydovora]
MSKTVSCLFLAVILVLASFSTANAEFDIDGLLEILIEDEVDNENDSREDTDEEVDEFEEFESPVLLLGEPGSKEVLVEREIDKKVYPASITKIMTLLVAMEHIEEGKASFEDEVVISKNAEGVVGTTLFLEKGKTLTLKDLLKGIAVGSANDASIAVAEYISGSVSGFVEEMNRKAKELGMDNTNFKNPHGLHHDDHYTSARDIFKMSTELVKYGQVLDWFRIWLDESFLEGVIDEEGVYLSNTNKLIDWYPNCDGLKTGFTDEAGYGISATAKRDDRRFISIVLESENSEERFDEAADLLDYGFSNYEVENIYPAGDVLKEVPVNKGDKQNVNAVAADNLSVIYERGDDVDVDVEIELDSEILDAPIEKGQKIGKAYFDHSNKRTEVDLIAEQEISRGTYSDFFGRIIENWVKFGD